MPEFRRNPITGQWVIIATDRAKRPDDFRSQGRPEQGEFEEECPFCPGHEQATPPEVYAVGEPGRRADMPGWRVRTVPNKFPAVQTDEATEASEGVLAREAGQGWHEVTIESPSHRDHFALLGREQAVLVVETLRSRYRTVCGGRAIRHVCLFKNHGKMAGASLAHPHFQLIATSIVPPGVEAAAAAAGEHLAREGRDVFDAVIEAEVEAGERIVGADEDFVAFCPFASRGPFETWIVPRAGGGHFGELDDGAVEAFAGILQDVLRRLHDGLSNPEYNLMFHTAPVGSAPAGFRWYVQVLPRLTIAAGFEYATGMYVNPALPEQCAAFLRTLA